ncbi:PRA1 family protein H [Glycine soja]
MSLKQILAYPSVKKVVVYELVCQRLICAWKNSKDKYWMEDAPHKLLSILADDKTSALVRRSVLEPAFESWLRDTGFLKVLDHRTSSSAAATSLAPSPAPSSAASTLFSRLLTFLSLFTLNAFAKLAADDFAVDTPSWSRSFFAFFNSYSFPSSPS